MGSAWTKENKGHWMEANLCERTQWRTTDGKENGWLSDFHLNAICSESLKLRNYQGTIKMLVLKCSYGGGGGRLRPFNLKFATSIISPLGHPGTSVMSVLS